MGEHKVWTVPFDAPSLLNEEFGGDAQRMTAAKAEVESILSKHGVQLNDDNNSQAWFSGDLEAFKMLTQEAASERPDEDADLFLAYWAGEPVEIA